MAKNDTNKSQAELYREQRKERIAKANKKNAKSVEKGKAAANAAKKIVAVVVAVAIVLGAGAYAVKASGLAHRLSTAVTVGDTKVSSVEFNYYYNSMYQQMAYYAQMYTQYGMDMGFDSSISPDQQTTTDEDGNEITWAEYFEKSAASRAQFVEAYYAEAIAAGFELDDDAKAEIDETIENYRSNATENGYSMNAYLKSAFGGGFTEKKFRTQLEKEEISSHFYEAKKAELTEAVTDADIKAEYDANKKDYDYVDITYYVFAGTALTAKSGEADDALKARQDEANKKFFKEVKDILAKVTDADTLEAEVKAYKAADKADEDAEAEEKDTTYCTTSKHTTYENIKSAMNDKVADWAYSAKTKAGEVKYFENGNDAYIVVLVKKAYNSNSVDVRHCLVSFDAEDEDNVTDEEKAAAKKKAEDLLKEWKKGDATEETFATMAKENSGDEGSTENGGLYAGMRITDSYVEPFLDWSFDDARKEGDTGIIETEYGYHIMYFSKDNTDDLDWQKTIRDAKGNEAFEAYDDALLGEDGNYAIETSEFWTAHISKEFCKRIAKSLAYSSSK